MRLMNRLVAGAGALTLAAGALALVSPTAGAAQTVVDCGTGGMIYATLNPTLGSGDAKYTKVAVKNADGSKHLSLTGAEDLGPTPASTLTCTVDAGIRTENAATNSASGKDNPYDNQSNGFTTLHIVKQSGAFGGSASCNRSDPSLTTTYPAAYPINGKLVWKFSELDAKLHPIQIQQFIRLGTDTADPDITHITVTGTVLKGPGVGGDVSATLAFGALYDPKGNLNLLDCTETNAAQNASLKSLLIQAADGPDTDSLPDSWVISIPS